MFKTHRVIAILLTLEGKGNKLLRKVKPSASSNQFTDSSLLA
jgi:hypothetical protein